MTPKLTYAQKFALRWVTNTWTCYWGGPHTGSLKALARKGVIESRPYPDKFFLGRPQYRLFQEPSRVDSAEGVTNAQDNIRAL